MSNWIEWGAYCTMLVESSQTFGSTDLHWTSVESDFLLPTNRLYGGGVGLIQTTSKNFELLLSIKNKGFDISGMSNGVIKSDLLNGSKSIDWFKSSASAGGGLFNLAETQFIQTMLGSDEGKETQVEFARDYFTVDNAVYMTMLENAQCPDVVKAFLMHMVVLMPASIRGLTAPPVAQDLQTAKQQCLTYTGASAGYINRNDTLIAYYAQVDLNDEPPINIFDYQGSGNSTPVPPPIETPGEGNGNNSGGVSPEKPTRVELTGGDFYLTNTRLLKSDNTFFLERFRNHFRLVFDTEEQKEENQEQDMEDTSQQPNPTIPDDTNNIIEEFINELLAIPLNTLNYANIRPQQNPRECGWADCSGYVGWGLRNIHPTIWNSGYLHTGTIYNIFKNAGYLIWTGPFNELHNQSPQRGDILEFSDDTTFGAGLSKHVIVFLGNNEITDMNGYGNMIQNYDTLLNVYASLNFNYACIIRIVK